MDLDPAMTAALLATLDECGIGAYVGDGCRLLDVNSSMCALFGRERDELLGAEPTTFLAASDRDLMTERRADWSGDVATRTASILRPQDDPVPAIVASAAAHEGVRVGIVLDRSALAAAELDLELFRTMADHSPAGVLVLDGRGVERGVDLRLRWASLPVLHMLGADRDSTIGRRLGEVVPILEPALADRALALCGTDRVEHIGEAVLPGRGTGRRVLNRLLIGLPKDLVAVRVADVTDERQEAHQRAALLRRLVDLGDAERKRLAMDLHDDAIQQAAAAAMLLEGLARHPDAADRDARLGAASAAAREVVASLRRLVFELSPPELVESGLDVALRTAAEYLFASTNVELELELDELQHVRLVEPLLTTAYRIAVEALTNVRKHARARHVMIRLTSEAEHVALLVRDDGVGLRHGIDDLGHYGIRSMIERAAGLGGVCTVTSGAAGGVEVHAVLPTDVDDLPSVVRLVREGP